MEKRKGSFTAGKLEWTQAPEHHSPASPEVSELSWEGKEEEEEDFLSQMDERGIIGLQENHEEELMLGLEEELDPDEEFGLPQYSDKVPSVERQVWTVGEKEQGFGKKDEWDKEQKQRGSGLWDTGTPEPHEGPPMTVQDLTFCLSELLNSDLVKDNTNMELQFQNQYIDGQDSAVMQEFWSEDEEVHVVEKEGDANQVTCNQNRTPSQIDGQLDMTEDEPPESEWEESMNGPATQAKTRESGSRAGHSSLEYQTPSNGLESSEGKSMKIDLLSLQNADQLTSTPSYRRKDLEVQEQFYSPHSVCKSDLKLGGRNISELEPGCNSSAKHDLQLQKCSEFSDQTFSKEELTDPLCRSSRRPSHCRKQKNRSLVAYSQVFDAQVQRCKSDAQNVAQKISVCTRYSPSHTSTSSPSPTLPAVPHICPPSHVLCLSLEDPIDFNDIQEERLPEVSCTESLTESSMCYPRPTPSPWRAKHDPQDSPQSLAPPLSKAEHRESPSRSSLHRSRYHQSPNINKKQGRNNSPCHRHTGPAANHTDVRRGKLTHPCPDFSKVQPRVHFPKKDYKPPKSRRSVQQEGMAAEPPMVFKSPAEIVQEVLLSSGEGTEELEGLKDGGTPCLLKRTVPEDFRDPQQASTLMQQLQEDYKRLLTKYAEAENTIDRLRLEAKVSLHLNLPKPSHFVQSGAMREGSKVMTLTFPQAQRAELDTPQHTPHRSNSGLGYAALYPSRPSSVAAPPQQLTADLHSHIQRFYLQLDAFEELMRRGELKAYKQMKGLCELSQGQEALEKAYLAAREEHKLIQQTGDRLPPFDPNRVPFVLWV
ncbi:hypothetical protein ACEWY4_003914 [Coilia grayii]|uniref:AT-hook-containing transcription factor n=1 Tax=Coilia grayii TaxID=363190 RepID=A0ABD1KK05_9TELE